MSYVNVPVRTELTGAQYRALADLAKQHRTTVSSLVRECVRRQLIGRPEPARPVKARMPEEQIAAIRDLHGQGLSDTAISKQLELPRSTVSYRRQALGLPPLFSGRPKKTREEEAS